MATILALIIGAAMAYYVYTDSEGRGMNQMLWTILTFVFGLLALIPYLIIRKPKGSGGGGSDLLDDDMA